MSEDFGCTKHFLWRSDCADCRALTEPTLSDAINAVRFGDPVKAIEAFNRGAAAAGGSCHDTIEPGEQLIEMEDGTFVRVLFVDPTVDEQICPLFKIPCTCKPGPCPRAHEPG